MLQRSSFLGARRLEKDPSGARLPNQRLRFVDLFAGLGGFHTGLASLGHECVFACEIDPELRDVYEQNFGIVPHSDIRQVEAPDVPTHDVLCAGFPCQPFSLAGKKAGAACPSSGKLIDDVFRIIGHHRPSYVLLENVPNVLTIADGSFWNHIQDTFAALGYQVQHRVYSSLQFGFPQQRYRLFVIASRNDLSDFEWPEPRVAVTPLTDLIIENPVDIRAIEPAKISVLEKWNGILPVLKDFSSLTIIAAEFGATYPLDGLPKAWKECRGAFGAPLAECVDYSNAMKSLPHYAATTENGVPPAWMHEHIRYSREVYSRNPEFFDKWKADLIGLPNSWQKFEWRGNRQVPDIWKHTIQFRASGIRVMKPELAPSLVAMTPTQTPIVGCKRRYLSVREAAALQALQTLEVFPASMPRAFKALGNAVNAAIVKEISSRLFCCEGN